MSVASAEQGGVARLTTLVAVDVLPLRPRGCHDLATTTEEAELWPAFVVVVSEPDPPEQGTAKPLFDLLGRPTRPDVTILGGHCDWSVLNPALALLELTLRTTEPVRFAVRVIVPAGPLLGTLATAAAGRMMAITTRQRAVRLSVRREIQHVLQEVVLLACPVTQTLEALAQSLRTSTAEQ
jgi:hypothetical protein